MFSKLACLCRSRKANVYRHSEIMNYVPTAITRFFSYSFYKTWRIFQSAISLLRCHSVPLPVAVSSPFPRISCFPHIPCSPRHSLSRYPGGGRGGSTVVAVETCFPWPEHFSVRPVTGHSPLQRNRVSVWLLTSLCIHGLPGRNHTTWETFHW